MKYFFVKYFLIVMSYKEGNENKKITNDGLKKKLSKIRRQLSSIGAIWLL